MNFFPVGLDLRGRNCIVVGGGSVGTRKVNSLLLAGAQVTLVSPEGTEKLSGLFRVEQIHWERRPYQDGDLEGAFLVVAATDDPQVNDGIASAGRRAGVLVCDASSAGRSDLIFGALHRSDPAIVAVFTDGTDPARARRVRDRIADLEAEWSAD
jgi:siroheme synthase-like protein